eukprot:Opistho-2@60365
MSLSSAHDHSVHGNSHGSGDSHATHTNRLAKEKSPYLLQHAHNPVDWYPWGEEAFREARARDVPIFLSVGYSTCHWCHVMERESFENGAVARILNENFVSIKVDREERPDVDRVYMSFVQATTGHGGWPLSVWLTPAGLQPFMGGTYFSPEDSFGRPGFGTVLLNIGRLWKSKRDDIVEEGSRLTQLLAAHSELKPPSKTGMSDDQVVKHAYEKFKGSFDETFGGFGAAPKFPRPAIFDFLLRFYARDPQSAQGKHALAMCTKTLKAISQGGMHDHIGSGFHRYSVDRIWHVPHFEKMLYDQAQLLVSYVDAFQITGDTDLAWAAKDIVTYVTRDLQDDSGAFFSAEDADSYPRQGSVEKSEGAFCVWTTDELRRILSDKVPGTDSTTAADIFISRYGVHSTGNVPRQQDPHGELAGQNVLFISATIAEISHKYAIPEESCKHVLDECRTKLLEIRKGRPRPHLDDKILVAWNGLMISGLARAAQAFDDVDLARLAGRAAGFFRAHMYDQHSKKLLRSFRQGPANISGFADDYAFLIRGLLDLYEAAGDEAWVRWAVELQESMDSQFWDAQSGGYFSSPEDDPNIIMRLKEDHDGAEPSPNSVSAMNLLRLGCMFDSDAYRGRAEQIFALYRGAMEDMPTAIPEMLASRLFAMVPTQLVAIGGSRNGLQRCELVRIVHEKFRPFKAVLQVDADSALIPERLPFARELRNAPLATAHICRNMACGMPTSSPQELRSLLDPEY